MSRLFGIETEYGIAVEGQPDTDPVQQSVELIKSYRSDDFRPMWDYRGEDPFRDERGFRAEVLHEHPDEKAYQEQVTANNAQVAEHNQQQKPKR